MSLPRIPVYDCRAEGMTGYIRASGPRAERIMDVVLAGMGTIGRIGRPLLPIADRIADRRLITMSDPYHSEIRTVRQIVGRPGPIAFNLSYEFGCTARGFETEGMPELFRTLDWPFQGLGELIEILILPGECGDWITATWPGIAGTLHGAAPGRFAAAINQAPERMSPTGRAGSWISSKRAVMKSRAIPPAHLLRRVFETAPDYASAKKMLCHTPVAAPVIFTLSGTTEGEVCTIERTETGWALADHPAAANHFASELKARDRWRPRGMDSTGRRDAILALDRPPETDALAPPVLNDLTRLSLVADAGGRIVVTGYDGERQVTASTAAQVPEPSDRSAVVARAD